MMALPTCIPVVLLVLLSGLPGSSAFVPKSSCIHFSRSVVAALSMSSSSSDSLPEVGLRLLNSRRSFLLVGSASVVTCTTSSLVGTSPAAATIMDTSMEGAKTFRPGTKLGVEEGKKRFSLARRDVQYLLDNYDEISKGGGDAVRRYLGTVGVTSYMYGITKVLKDLRDEADDIVDFTETCNEFEAYLYQAEGAAYQSLFVEHSSAKGTPESFLATAKKDVQSMKRYMDELAAQLKL